MKIAVRLVAIMQIVFMTNTVSNAQTYKLDSVKVEFEGFDTETFHDVSCEAFNSAFVKTKKTKVFCNGRYLTTIKSLSNEFKPAKKQSFDVRGAIVYSYEKTAVKYCFDVWGYFYKDGKMYYNKNLLIYIADKLNTNHPKYLDTLRQQ